LLASEYIKLEQLAACQCNLLRQIHLFPNDNDINGDVIANIARQGKPAAYGINERALRLRRQAKNQNEMRLEERSPCRAG
jgi:hypothetical protein